MNYKIEVIILNKIIEMLGNIETRNNIEILYAVESGSRIYGFANKDSDYDVRFVYKRPLKKYLNIIHPKKDVINFMSKDKKYDLVGWDINKALYLHYKSNPTLREWILSPIKYKDNPQLFEDLPKFNLENLYQHYYSLAKFNYRKYCTDDLTKFNHKKYLYVFRGLLSCQYINKYNREPPININELKTHFPEVLEQINILINYKEISKEQLIEYNSLVQNLFKKLYKKPSKVLVDDKDRLKIEECYNNKFLEIVL